MKKSALLVLAVVIVLVICYAAYQWFRPQRSAKDEKALAVSAQQLIDDYRKNEAAANTQYLDKTLLVSGIVGKLDTNQQGQQIAELTTSSPDATIFCTLATDEKNTLIPGETARLQGICKGYRDQLVMVDVVLQDCYIQKEKNN